MTYLEQIIINEFTKHIPPNSTINHSNNTISILTTINNEALQYHIQTTHTTINIKILSTVNQSNQITLNLSNPHIISQLKLHILEALAHHQYSTLISKLLFMNKYNP